jgi:hypothetical protein
MTEAVTIAQSLAADGALTRRRTTKLKTVSASTLALHFDCSRAYIDEFSQRRA